MATLDDIAKEAGVNKSTVSRALRNDTGLNTDTVERIRSIANRLHYQTKRRKGLELGPVCVICPSIDGGIYPRLAKGIVARMVEHGMECFIEISDFDSEREQLLLQTWSGRKISAIVIMTENTGLSPLIEANIKKYNIPIVQIAMSIETHAHDNIWVDEQVGLNKSVEHLVALGHTEIAFIGSRYSRKRLSCFELSMEHQELPVHKDLIKISDATRFQCGYETMGELLKEQRHPTAIVAEYDDIAIGAMKKTIEQGYRIPEDFSFVGFDDNDYCAYFPVSLTSVQNCSKTLCEAACNLLMKKIKDPSFHIAQSILIKPILVVRQSTGPAIKEW